MTAAPQPARRRAILMLVLGTLCWGLSFPLIKSITALSHILVPEAGTWFLASAAFAPRFIIAALIALAFGWRQLSSATGAEVKQAVVLGVFASGGTFFQTDALQFTDASTSAFLTQLSAILIPALFAVRSRRSPGARVWLACGLVLLGVAVLGHLNWRQLRLARGEAETILCSLFFVGQIVAVGQKRYAANRPSVVVLMMFGLQALILGGFAVAAAPNTRALLIPWMSVSWVVLTLVLAVVCTVTAFSIMNAWQPRISATEAGLIYCIEPLFASIFALFLPSLISILTGLNYSNEQATGSLIVGGGLITLANVIILTEKDPTENTGSLGRS